MYDTYSWTATLFTSLSLPVCDSLLFSHPVRFLLPNALVKAGAAAASLCPHPLAHQFNFSIFNKEGLKP